MAIYIDNVKQNYSEIPRSRLKRYVHTNVWNQFFWREVDRNNPSIEVREGRCDEIDLPVAIVNAARRRIGYWPAHVEWPVP